MATIIWIFRVVLLFNYQCTVAAFEPYTIGFKPRFFGSLTPLVVFVFCGATKISLSNTESFVNTFFNFFKINFLKCSYCSSWHLLFLIFRKKNNPASCCETGLPTNGEGGIWTLAPRKRPTPLAGAPLQPLEYFSVHWILL